MSEISYVSFDPGGSERPSTGVATWDREANCLGKAKLTPQHVYTFLEGLEGGKVHTFVIESYIGFGSVSHRGSKFKTSQQIGALKYFAQRHGIKVVEQAPEVKNIAQMWSGTKKSWRGKHMPDDISAFLHGYYYLYRQGLITPAVLGDKDLM